MRHSVSVPSRLHLSFRGKTASASRHGAELVAGSVVIRAAPHATKVMSVQFVTAAHELKIRFMQLTDGRVHAFELCRLDYRTLAAGWFWDDPTMFVLAVTDHGQLLHEIYCYPTDVTRNSWLRVFEGKRMQSMPIVGPRLLVDIRGSPQKIRERWFPVALW
jgi:hypothetical protein